MARSVAAASREPIHRAARVASASGSAIGSGRAPRTKRAAFHSLFVKFRPPVSFASVRRWSTPGALPETRAKRSASAPIVLDHLERVDDVALRLAHLRAGRVADDPVQVDRVERLDIGQEEAEHHHPRDPEEEDLVRGLHDDWSGRSARRSGVASGQPRVLNGHSPELNHVSKMSVSWVSSDAGRPHSAQASGPPSCIGDGDVAVRAEPGRDPVAPPQLTPDRPVVDVLHPVGVDLLEVRGDDPGPPFGDRCERALRQRLRPDEPLDAEARLDDGVALLAVADDHLVRPLALEVAHLAQPFDDRGSGLESIQAGELAAVLVHSRRLVQDADHRQAVAAAELVVVEVVRRRDLHGAGAELALDRWRRRRSAAADPGTAGSPRARRGRGTDRRRGGPRRRCRRGSSRAGWSRR